MSVDVTVTRLPFVDEVFKGELVKEVNPHDPPRAGYDAYVRLKPFPD